jgi:arylsulfatase A-like enzyme
MLSDPGSVVVSKGLRSIVLGLLLAGASPSLRADPPAAVVLVTIDTLRADHLPSYGYERPTAPFLDRLARDGVLFEQAFAASSMTAPCHASLFTGLYPPQHGVRKNEEGFAAAPQRRFRTMAEVLSEAGYTTAAFSGIGFLKSISQGFKTVDAGSGNFKHYRQADATVDKVIAWLDGRRKDERFFLWVHLFDVHPPHHLPPPGAPSLALQTASEADEFARRQIEDHAVDLAPFKTRAALTRSFNEYDNEVLFADSQLSRLFSAMEQRHLNEHALWIVTADHGEGLGNHGWLDHVRYLYNEAVRIPLIVYRPGLLPPGRVKALVRHVDIMPTLFQLLEVPFSQPGFTLPGRSILPLLEGQAMKPVVAFTLRRPWGSDHTDWEQGEVFGVQDLDWKYIVHTKGKDEFFDLRSDAYERKNLIDGSSPVKERLEDLAWKTFRALLREGHEAPAQADPAAIEELRGLGYVQ